MLRRLAGDAGREQKAGETKLTIDRLRTFAGYREYPKYAIVSRYFLYKRALMRGGRPACGGRLLGEREDVL